MNDGSRPKAISPKHVADAEWKCRTDLAAFYRIVAMLGWDEYIFTHISLRLPGPERHFLINPFGLLYEEVTASNLVRIDINGDVVGASDWPVNKAGFTIHSAIHEARDDAHCVIHTHTTAGMAIAQQPAGLLPTSFYSAMIVDRLSYHDFEGSVVSDGEKVRLVENLGTNNHLILRNHGLLACGADVAAAFSAILTLQRACEVQLAAQVGDEPLLTIGHDIRNAHRSALNKTVKDAPANDLSVIERAVFDAMVRKLDRLDPSYRQ
ncbi:class II aldolase/adducin family protein [Rhizorhabdus wittichii]|uniref:Class II aldolase/adducin family protein n=1 Tax=Rhizorhabdus wittichii (strain DSM 6014 / CCUG 31198 / JCM 15750 / NBRC 105917 / EY 4224 / RW1) TaxID=392499 RepID=A0A9J9HF27_RHIWR|nr:class II aldolase/adducin family protein [Rhizorhabdus wittichii]ABQ70540.1 class II aldolase/adducin family protein [Rhizorhabdus wittichii RW1]